MRLMPLVISKRQFATAPVSIPAHVTTGRNALGSRFNRLKSTIYPPSLAMLYKPDKMESSRVSSNEIGAVPSAADRIFLNLRAGIGQGVAGMTFRYIVYRKNKP